MTANVIDSSLKRNKLGFSKHVSCIGKKMVAKQEIYHLYVQKGIQPITFLFNSELFV